MVSSFARSACAQTSTRRARSSSASAFFSHSSSRDSSATPRTGWFNAMRCVRGTRVWTFASSFEPTRRSARGSIWTRCSTSAPSRRIPTSSSLASAISWPTGRPSVPDVTHVASGKVREIYALDDERLLLVASDRISTFDVVLPTPIPDKGRVLTGLSAFWFARTRDIIPNHLLALRPDGRSTECRRLEMLPLECVVRGYLTGSGWKDYQATGSVCGHELPSGLRESDQLPEPIFTPATKAEVGDHDENVDFDRAAEILGDRELLEELRRLSLELYSFAAEHARERGIILADTKFEFGRAADGEIVLGDEVLTPDSSRFWPADSYEVGRSQPSFDKQYVRDWAAGSGWDKTPPAPAL